ncbi:MAG TPA: glycerol-3-phosphate 1-O-acyltransferase [Planctomycetes bacterium]|nr:glycerol-3-phosphate 1-O-acyltransferase [Planctomycetota bacterium]
MSPWGALGWIVLSYLVGTISWSYLIVRKVKGTDLRDFGSGNLGATNAGRVLGRRYAIFIYVLDFLKGLAAVLPARHLFPCDLGGIPLELYAGLAVVVGHIFPFWLGFKGGKGVATGSGVVFALSPWTALGALATWAMSLALFRMVSLSSILAAASLPLWYGFLEGWSGAHVTRVVFLATVAALVVVLHRTNLQRILAGDEDKIGE